MWTLNPNVEISLTSLLSSKDVACCWTLDDEILAFPNVPVVIFDAGNPRTIPGAFFVSVAPCGVTSIVLCSAYNVNPQNIIKAIFISTFASIGTIFFAIKYLTI